MPRFVLGSLATHVLILVVLIFLPSLRGRRSMPESALIVDLVPIATSAPTAASPAVAPPQPAAPVTPAEGVRVETSVPERTPEPVKKSPPEEPEPRPREAATPPPQSAPPSPPAETQPAPGEAGGGSGVTGATIEAMEGAGDFELGWYKASVTAALFGQWRKPILEGMTEPREVRVTFDILRDGRVADARIDESSGVPSLDRSALRAVTDASPLPPLPASWSENRMSAGFVFRLYPE
jgi:protein TonB